MKRKETLKTNAKESIVNLETCSPVDEDVDITSTQSMIDDARARRQLRNEKAENQFTCDECHFGQKNGKFLKRS